MGVALSRQGWRRPRKLSAGEECKFTTVARPGSSEVFVDRPEVTKLYKYRVYNEQNLKILEQRRIYFPAAEKFNDPFDCAIEPIADVADPDELIELTATQFASYNPPIPKDETRRQLESLKNVGPDLMHRILSLFKDREILLNRKTLGVFTMSELNDHPLLWAHYADSHRGFCIEFERTPTNDFGLAKPMTYSDAYPEVDLFRMLLEQRAKLSVFTKASCWAYEKEWRRVIPEANVFRQHYEGMISGIIFGAKMKKAHKARIRATFFGDKKVRYYQARLKERDYGLLIEPEPVLRPLVKL